jgi:hypothetical protein
MKKIELASFFLVGQIGAKNKLLGFESWYLTLLQQYISYILVVSRWFSPGTLVSSPNKTDCHDITEILLKVALNIMTL